MGNIGTEAPEIEVLPVEHPHLDTYVRLQWAKRHGSDLGEILTGCVVYGLLAATVGLFLVGFGFLIRALIIWLVHAF